MGKDGDRSRKRKSRWDEEGGGGSGGNSRRIRHENRSRSRSPVKVKDAKFPEEESFKKKNNVSNNWSDSSSDEEHGGGRTGRRNGDERANIRGRFSENNNGEFKMIEERVGLGLDLGYQREQFPILDQFPVTTTREFVQSQIQGFGSSVPSAERMNIKSLNNNNDNYHSTTSNGSGGSMPMGVKVATTPGIQIKMMPAIVKPVPNAASVPVKPKISSVFNVDDDDDEEEMPPECKMRMKNIGRETPTSAGPNSFGKTKLGFCNTTQIKERKLEEKLLKKK